MASEIGEFEYHKVVDVQIFEGLLDRDKRESRKPERVAHTESELAREVPRKDHYSWQKAG